MQNTYHLRFITLSTLLFLCSTTSPAENSYNHLVTVGNEQLHFIAQPQAGYVLKTRDDIDSMDIVSRFLKSTGDVKISPIRGLGRKGTYVIYYERPAEENERTIKSLRVYNEVKYAAPLFSSNGETVAVIPEIVIRVKPGTQIEQVEAICETAGCVIIKQMEFTEQEYLLDVTGIDAAAIFAALEQFNEIALVEWAAPNTAFQPKLCSQAISGGFAPGEQYQIAAAEDANSAGVLPNDEYFPMQWHLHNTGQSGGTPGADIRAPEAWEITTGDPNIVVAVIDGGVDSIHPDLIDNLVPGYDFYDSDDLPDPALDHWGNAHGTCCGGLIAAQGNNGIGVTGVTWNCKIMPIRIWWRYDDGTTYWITEADTATAFRWTANKGADVLSNSWTFGTTPTPIFQSAIADITRTGGIGRGGKGCIVLFCTGNDSGPLPYPDRYPEVISVGATDHNDVRCYYSNYGPELDLVAPSSAGVGESDLTSAGGRGWLWTTDIYGPAGYNSRPGYPYAEVLDYGLFQGTSGACPIAAGVAALILSVDPNLTNLEVQRILYRSARDLGEPGWDQYYGWGRVDARAAVEMALNPTAPIYVDDDAPNDPGPGDPNINDPNENGSAEHPFDSIQKAINFALDTEKIAVLPGRYTGEGNRVIDFGGKILTIQSEAGPATCVIDCQGLGRGFNFHSGEGRDSVLEGFTIINGKGDNGGAISCMNNSSPTIRNCIFSRNSALGLGGAVSNSDSAVALINCTFHANTDMFGGGAVCNIAEGMIITNCILWDNEPGEIYSFGTIDVTYSNISGGFAGVGYIDIDPLFADAENGDYHLKSQTGRWDPNSGSWVKDDVTSPCIDAGDPNSDWAGETWPYGERINMGAYGGTREASMSTQPQPMSLPRIAYIYSADSEAAKSFQSLLSGYGCPTTLVGLDQAPAAGLEDYDLLIVGDDTEDAAAWNDPQVAAAIEGAGRPIVGMGEGAYDFFGVLGLSIGRPHGWHGDNNSIYVIDPNCSLYSTPYVIDVPEDRMLQLYTETKHVGINLFPVPQTVLALGAETYRLGYYPLALEHDRYLLWGFEETPQKMTEVGKKLFINVVIRTANTAWESDN